MNFLKKCLALVLSLCMLVPLVACSDDETSSPNVPPAEEKGTEGLSFSPYGEGLAVSVGSATKVEVVTVPKTYGGKPVLAVAAGGFADCMELKDISLPEGLQVIGDRAFFGAINLKTAVLPTTLTSIGASAFARCVSLETSAIPASVTSIGASAFADCSSITQMNIYAAVTVLPDSVFEDCKKLATVTLPATLERIGEYAFWACTSLSAVSFPASLVEVGDSAFGYCVALSEVSFAEGSACARIGQSAFEHAAALTAISLPATLTVIGDMAFSHVPLTSFTLLGWEGNWQATVSESAESGIPVAFGTDAAANAALVQEMNVYCFLKK